MGIAEQIVRVEREFVSGEQLVKALARQESISELHAASWLLRNIQAFDAVPMLEFNRAKRDFRAIEIPWSSDVLRDIVTEDGLAVWAEEGSGYVGGWLASDLRTFFSKTDVSFPEAYLAEETHPSSSTPVPEILAESMPTGPTIAQYLASHSKDFRRLDAWLKSVDRDTHRTSMALRIAIEKIGGFIPLYHLESAQDYPEPIEIEDCAAIWSELLLDLAEGSLKDIVLGLPNNQERWVYCLYVKDSDCLAFLQRAGMHSDSVGGISPGVVARGRLDLKAAEARTAEALNSTSNQSPALPSSTDRELSNRERGNLLRAIGALLSFISGELPGIQRHPNFLSDTDLIRRLDDHFDGFEGLSASNLSRKFPAAKRLLRN